MVEGREGKATKQQLREKGEQKAPLALGEKND